MSVACGCDFERWISDLNPNNERKEKSNFDAHAAGAASDGANRRIQVGCGEVGHLGLGDVFSLGSGQLADLIGVTYQQAHKYEKGINRVSAGRLFCIAQVFGVSVSFFYEGLETVGDTPANERQRMCLELARNFSLITNSRHQEALTQLARALASNSGTQTDAFIPEKTPEPIVFAEA